MKTLVALTVALITSLLLTGCVRTLTIECTTSPAGVRTCVQGSEVSLP